MVTSSSLSTKFPSTPEKLKNKIKWGVYLREPYWTVEQLEEFVTKIENLGFHGIYTNDHLTGFNKQVNGKEPYLEAWTFITTILSWCKHLNAGHTVICQSFRNPALLAKMVSTLDILSNGRFELFLGAGWKEDEYLAYGYKFPSPGVRLRQVEESVLILRNLFNPEIDEWDFEGEFWSLVKSRNFPKPITQPFKIHLGGNKPKFIKMTARIADGFNTTGTVLESSRRFKQYDMELTRMGINPKKRIKSYFGSLFIFKSEEETIQFAKEQIKKKSSFENMKPHEVVEDNLWGTTEGLAAKLRKFIFETGVNKLMLKYQSSLMDDPLEAFWDEVHPLI